VPLGRLGIFKSSNYEKEEYFKGVDNSFNDQSDLELLTERSKRWILLVDDEEMIRKSVGKLLYEYGYQVTACADGPTALQVAKSRVDAETPSTPSAIILDVRMPGDMDGIQLLNAIRQDKELVQVPVILLTARGMAQDRIAGYDAGADAYLLKPYDPDELLAIVDSVIKRHQMLNSDIADPVDVKRELADIKQLLLEKGGGGVGIGYVRRADANNDEDVFLAPDEREILNLLCEGLMNKEIAERLFLSTRRVEQLITIMFRKTKVKNRTALVRWAISTGTVQI
jgi:DNA-binding NarL/FixJ family response regulator